MDPIAEMIVVGDEALAHVRRQCPTAHLAGRLEQALNRLEAYHLELVLRGVCPAEVPAPTPQEQPS